MGILLSPSVQATPQINTRAERDRSVMNTDTPAYGLWALVIINAAMFLIFALSFAKPQTRRDWRSFGAFSAFVIALFAEMYGFPLTIYLLSSWLGSRFPGLDLFAHNNGHLWQTLFGLQGDPHLSLLHWIADGLIVAGFILIGSAWKVLYAAQQAHEVAATGAYAHVRHPQYVGFVVIMLGFLLEWPTLLTLIMFPILVTMYIRLAHREEREALAQYGAAYANYATSTPAFFPHWRRTPSKQMR